MLVEFRVKNYRSIKDEQVLSMVASSDKSLPQNCIEVKGIRLLKGAAIYGPNAAGKSNLVRALKTMRGIVVYSSDNKPGDSINISSFAFDSEEKEYPTEFEVTFIHEDIKYQYGFSIHEGKVHEEWLFAFPSSSAQKWFERSSSKGKESYIFGAYFKGRKKQIKESTKNNTLFLSMAAQLNHDQLTPIYSWFGEFLQLALPHASHHPITAIALDGYKNKAELKRDVIEFLHDADLDIADLKVKKTLLEDILKRVSPEAPDEFRQFLRENYRKNPEFDIDLLHEISGKDKPIALKMKDESDGTQRLFDLAVPCMVARGLGYTSVIDEIEESLHPLLIRNLVQYFLSKKNTSGAQLIFTTHNTTLLSPDLLRRDQVWLCERDKFAATHLYSLWDFKDRPRNKESLQKGYLSGRYGAIPFLEAFGEKR